MKREKWKKSSFRQPAIIDRVTFEKAKRRLLSEKYLSRRKQDEHLYLLRGLLKCDCCSSTKEGEKKYMTWVGERKRIKKGKDRFSFYYKCGQRKGGKTSSQCKTLPINADEIEAFVLEFVKKLLKNPKAAFEYQQGLKSTQKEVEKLRKEAERLRKVVNGTPEREQSLRFQHTEGFIDSDTLKAEIEQIRNGARETKKTLETVEEQIAQKTLSTGYQKTLEAFSEKYKKMLTSVTKDREELYKIFHLLIQEIIVYSRPVTPSDPIAGRRTAGQKITHKLLFKLKLPQDILEEFGANSDKWWVRWGSNPRPIA
ncbi:MAG: zinc ribbon domain-containing protein [Candidatus Gracilibacteria bacterium]|nr:zinc ribbon domain-containing protein [Candidatus Gracilibacteria bacterium]